MTPRRDTERNDRLLHRGRTLEELESARWPAPGPTTHLVQTVHGLRRKPVGTLTPAELRLMIAQHVGLPYLLPPAMEILRNDPLVDAWFYEGDLLQAVLSAAPEAWVLLPDLSRELREIVGSLPEVPDEVRHTAEDFMNRPAHEGK
ncbi:contact-dependent growth inhibition system immunity protein [Streptomyces peucetius]